MLMTLWNSQSRNMIRAWFTMVGTSIRNAVVIVAMTITSSATTARERSPPRLSGEGGIVLVWRLLNSAPEDLIRTEKKALKQARDLIRADDSVSVVPPNAQSGFHWGHDRLVCEGRSVTTLLEVPDAGKKSSLPSDSLVYMYTHGWAVPAREWQRPPDRE